MADSKPSANSFAAGLPTSQGLSPLQWSDKCFLCSREIGETDPRGFYQGTAAMMLCHRGCLNVMDTSGGTPEDYHRAVTSAAASGPAWLDFPDLAALQAYIKAKGDIPATAKVTVAGQAIQG